MQSLTSTLGRLAMVLTGALALGSCSRANYAFLPKADSYLGTTAAEPKVHHAAPVVATTTAPAQVVVASPAPVPAAPAATATPAVAPEITVATAPVAAAEPAPAPVAQASPATVTPSTTATAPAAAPKLNLVQRLALNKVMRKLDRQTQKISARKADNTASTARVDSKLRYAIIFGAISLIFFVIGGSVGNLIGAILLIIGLLFLLFWLLDNL